jgi:anti-sigma B factor antagonist
MKLGDVKFTHQDQFLIARMGGEVDLSNAESIGDAIAETTPNHVLGLILDLSELDYLDSAGIHLIYKLRERLRARGQTLGLVVPAGSPSNDALRLAGVKLHVRIAETVQAALRDAAVERF